MTVHEVLAVAAAGEGAVVVLAHGHIGAAEGDHVGPDLIDVGGAGEVYHIGGEAAAGAHIDFEGHDLALLAHAGLVLGHPEELKVDKAALDAEALDDGTACGAGVLGQVLDDVVDGVVVVVHDVHDGHGTDVPGLKDGVSGGVDDGVVAVDLGADELLHDVGDVRVILGLAGEEGLQLFVIGQPVGIGSAHAVVGLDHHRVSHLLDESLAAVEIVHHVVAGSGDAGLPVVLLHLALVLDAGHILGLEAGGDVEVGAQGSVPLQPVFVVGLQPVDAAILEDEEGHSAVDFVVILEAADLVVLVQAVLQLRLQLIVGLVADAQHIHAVVLQLPAELPVVRREVRGDKNKILHNFASSFLEYPLFAASRKETLQKPLPLGEVSPQVTERASTVKQRRRTAISRPFVRAMLSQSLFVSFQRPCPLRRSRASSPKGRAFRHPKIYGM